MEAEQVIAAIQKAFPLEPLPEISLHQAQLADQSMSREIPEHEWNEAGRADADRTWPDFGEQELMACDAALSHFDDASFVYYLPAFLLFAIRHCGVTWPHPAEPLLGSVVFSVTHRTPYTLSRFKCLSSEQRATVVAFLELVAKNGNDHDRPQAEKALSRYWKTDEASRPLIIIP
jgi:hypothetical protein